VPPCDNSIAVSNNNNNNNIKSTETIAGGPGLRWENVREDMG
jgi:hypothetical protein